jgi:hypothetical protein
MNRSAEPVTETRSTPVPLCIWTFVTPGGQRCSFAGIAEFAPDGSPRPLALPDDVLQELHIFRARRAWMYTAAPCETCTPDAAANACDPVVSVPLTAVGQLVWG